MPDTETTTAPVAESAVNITLNGNEYPLIDKVLPKRKLRNGTERPASLVLVPQITTLALSISFITDVLTAAEKAKAGAAAKLVEEFTGDRAKEATSVALDEKTAELDNDKYTAKFVSTEAERGDSLKALHERENKLVNESLSVMKALIAIGNAQKHDANFTPDWADISAKLGRQFAEEEQLALYMLSLDQARDEVAAAIAKKEAAAEKAAETREAKKKAAPAAPATPATPAEPNVSH